MEGEDPQNKKKQSMPQLQRPIRAIDDSPPAKQNDSQQDFEESKNGVLLSLLASSQNNLEFQKVLSILQNDKDLNYLIYYHETLLSILKNINGLSAEQMLNILIAATSEQYDDNEKEEDKSPQKLEKAKKEDNMITIKDIPESVVPFDAETLKKQLTDLQNEYFEVNKQLSNEIALRKDIIHQFETEKESSYKNYHDEMSVLRQINKDLRDDDKSNRAKIEEQDKYIKEMESAIHHSMITHKEPKEQASYNVVKDKKMTLEDLLARKEEELFIAKKNFENLKSGHEMQQSMYDQSHNYFLKTQNEHLNKENMELKYRMQLLENEKNANAMHYKSLMDSSIEKWKQEFLDEFYEFKEKADQRIMSEREKNLQLSTQIDSLIERNLMLKEQIDFYSIRTGELEKALLDSEKSKNQMYDDIEFQNTYKSSNIKLIEKLKMDLEIEQRRNQDFNNKIKILECDIKKTKEKYAKLKNQDTNYRTNSIMADKIIDDLKKQLKIQSEDMRNKDYQKRRLEEQLQKYNHAL